jgi:CheY-like chemotaxis protein
MAGELQGKRVLVVEDHYLIADDVRRFLKDNGAVVVGPVAQRAEALATVYRSQIDIAVLDINLDGDDVYPVADELRRRGIPFVFLTGYADKAVKGEYRSAPHIEKPYDARKLMAAMKKAAGQTNGAPAG